jgi:hypothetical protein
LIAKTCADVTIPANFRLDRGFNQLERLRDNLIAVNNADLTPEEQVLKTLIVAHFPNYVEDQRHYALSMNSAQD